jgi:hypothetical protein
VLVGFGTEYRGIDRYTTKLFLPVDFAETQLHLWTGLNAFAVNVSQTNHVTCKHVQADQILPSFATIFAGLTDLLEYVSSL